MGRFVTRIAVTIAALLIVLLAAVAAAWFFAYAIYLWIAEALAPPAAAALTGVAVLVGAIVIAAIVAAVFRPRRSTKIPILEGYETVAGAGNLLGRKVRGLLDAHSLGGLIAIGIAGFVLGVSPRLRKLLLQILRW